MWAPCISENIANVQDNLFRGYSRYIRHETFSFMMSLPAMSLGLRFCVSRKGGTGGGGWVHPKGANSMAASGLVFRRGVYIWWNGMVEWNSGMDYWNDEMLHRTYLIIQHVLYSEQ